MSPGLSAWEIFLCSFESITAIQGVVSMAEAKVIIKSENNISKGLNSAKKDLSGFEQYAAGIGEKLKSAFAATAILAAVKKITDGLSDCFKAFNEADRAYKRLSLSLSDTKGFNSVKQNITSLSKITLSSKDDIEAMVSELAALGKSSDEINAISEAAVHLSNVTGKDLNSSMTTLLNTYNGTTTQLNRLGIDTSNLTKEELAQGAAIDLVTAKFGELSRAMAADDSTQTIKNIKDNLGDIGQSIGQIVNVSLAPLLKNIETVTNWAKDKVQDVADTITVFIQGFPAIWENFLTALKSTFDNFWKTITSVEGIKTWLDGVIKIAFNRIQLIGNAIANIWDLTIKVGEKALKGIGNLAMSWVVGITDSIGVNFSDIINSIGKWLLESPIGKFVDTVISKAVNGVKLVGTIIKNLPQIVKIVIQNIGNLITEFFKSLPEYLKNVFKGIGNWILYGIQKIKNDFLQTIQDAINNLGTIISNTWVGKALAWMGLDLGGKLAGIDFGIDRTKQDSYKATADSFFGSAHDAMSGVREISAEMGKQISDLLSPQIEEWQSNASESIGQKLIAFEAKSSDEYFEMAKENFSDIGSFIKDWGKDFLGDLGDDWNNLQKTMGDVFENTFGGDMGNFIDWFKEYIKTLKTNRQSEGLPTLETGSVGSSEGTNSAVEKASQTFLDTFAASIGNKLGTLGLFKGASSEQLGAAGSSLLGTAVSSFGEAGEVVSNLAQNMATMGPMLGAIVTALQYVIQGFAEVMGPVFNDFVKYGIEPLKEIGRVIADILMPIMEDIMPSIKQTADFLIGVFDLLGMVIKPIVSFISSFLTPVLSTITAILQILEGPLKLIAKGLIAVGETLGWLGDWIRHIVATVVNWLASWMPWMSGTADPGKPGDLGARIQNSWDNVDNAFLRSSEEGTSTQAAIQNAAYSGATSVTINIYQEAPIVGTGGMLEFAQMIRDQFETLDYYGVSA